MANRAFQTLLFKLKDIFSREIGYIDEGGFLFSTKEGAHIEADIDDIVLLCAEPGKIVRYKGFTFLSAGVRGSQVLIFFVAGEDDEAAKDCQVLCAAVSGMKQFHDEKFDKTNFIKSIITDNILPGDVFVKAKEMHLAYEMSRMVFAVRTSGTNNDFDVFDVILGLFPDNGKNFVINIDNNNIVLVKEVRPSISAEEAEKIARDIVDTLQSEAMVGVSVGIGSVVNNIRDLAKSYKEAQVAFEVGKVFDTEKNIINYGNLGIGRLIYQLPTTLCELFLSEVFKKETIDSLDQETIFTIQKFFENNLNVSETARQLYVHRNTLVYRLDKVQKITGLDLRIFDHAIVFKVAMMVKKYLVANPIKM